MQLNCVLSFAESGRAHRCRLIALRMFAFFGPGGMLAVAPAGARPVDVAQPATRRCWHEHEHLQ